jgi:hypothetical protein
MSDTLPTMIRFQDTRTPSQRLPSDLEMSHTETESTEAALSKSSVKLGHCTVTEFDSPV